MDASELMDLVKQVGLPMNCGENDWTTVHFLDGRAYNLPLKLSDCAKEILERQQPPDHIMKVLGYRMPDIIKWIEPTTIPFTIYIPA